jgi:lipoprotein signal peptidase
MKVTTLNIVHPTFGKIVSENFTDATQLKLFLGMVQVSIDSDKGFHHFNVTDTLIQIPASILKECLIFTNAERVTHTEQVLAKIKA